MKRSLSDYAIYAESLAAVAAASLAIKAAPFKKIGAFASRPPRKTRAADPAEIVQLRRAVQAWGRRTPWRVVCFQSALALQMLLRRRGVPATLHYGISQAEALKAHVWLSVAGEIVIGGEEAVRYTEVAAFPPAAGNDTRKN